MTATKSHTFAQLNAEICDFRKIMGNRSFWARPQIVRNVLSGLMLVYTSTEFDSFAQQEQAEANYQAAIMDWRLRAEALRFDLAA